MSALDKLTESQFHTVWTEAVGRTGYNKEMFRRTLIALKEKGLIEETNIETSKGGKQPDTESKLHKHIVSNSVCYNGGFKNATRWHDCDNEDCKTCECNQQTDC